ncbi:MAG: hypothetical protein GY818_07005 [Planctomycetaceae bacterium]|nr:hypothetical protein [Planctomycetaceae bacterium]
MRNVETKTKESDKDLWSTADYVLDFVNKELGLFPVLDVCALEHNAKCARFITPEMDSLSVSWEEMIDHGRLVASPLPVAWMNPPFSRKHDFFEKAYKESKKMIVVAIFPGETISGWFVEHIENKATDIFLPKNRINYIDPKTKRLKSGVNFPSALCIFAPWGGRRKANYHRVDIKRERSKK